MPLTNLAALWTPDLWIQGVAEAARSLPSVLNSGAVTRSELLDSIATGPGVSAKMPFFRDVTDEDDEVQAENTAATTTALASAQQICTILNRQFGYDITALSAQVSGSDPVAYATSQIAARRLMARLKTLIAVLRGSFGVAAMAAASKDIHLETTVGLGAGNLITGATVIDALTLMGELNDAVRNGVCLMHPVVRGNLLKQDEIDFQRPSSGGNTLETYKGIPLFVSNKLVRAGTTSGLVYETYIMSRGVVGYGEKAQAGDVIDVASLQFDTDKSKNNQQIYDRTRFIMHLNGLKWTGTPAGQSATNAELATAANWALAFGTADRVGAVRILSNG
jgi:hypothetical protein